VIGETRTNERKCLPGHSLGNSRASRTQPHQILSHTIPATADASGGGGAYPPKVEGDGYTHPRCICERRSGMGRLMRRGGGRCPGEAGALGGAAAKRGSMGGGGASLQGTKLRGDGRLSRARSRLIGPDPGHCVRHVDLHTSSFKRGTS
jgi:hypothetical protein